ncbi:heterokaryon incompatibility protein-domain-containing protein [Rhexocercosporidium sp. MPI-PUGE-AT-0058]|nr:heterokaryon incompatibility protein-domain-containing protein [Rhexocercosporidium sp. MPI-PUGE-AT-0058]
MGKLDLLLEAFLDRPGLGRPHRPRGQPKGKVRREEDAMSDKEPPSMYRGQYGKDVLPFLASSRGNPLTPERRARRGSWGIDPIPNTRQPPTIIHPLDDAEAKQLEQTVDWGVVPKRDPVAVRWERRGSFGIDPVEIGSRCCYGIDGQHMASCVHAALSNPTDPFTQAGIRRAIATESWTNALGHPNLPPYIYQPLSGTRSIRLIKVQGFSQGGLNKLMIRCTIESHELDSIPTFQALSYTWASPMYQEFSGTYTAASGHGQNEAALHGEEIELDGSSCTISGNLFDALSWLAESKMQDYIWADAICIDQGNMKEKAVQISLMGDIYTGAKNVIVWLGKESLDLFDFSATRTKLSKAMSNLDRKEDATIQNPLDSDFLQKVGIESADEWIEMWRKYFRFFQRRRWFRRAWIVQEVALARDLSFQCGKKTLLWKDVYELGLLLRDSGWRHSLAEGMNSNPRGGIGDEADRLLEYRDQVQNGGPNDPKFAKMFADANGASSDLELWFSYLQYMIQEIRRYQASNMKDKIYAVLGLVKKFNPEYSADHITPDYSLPLEDIYTSVTMSILIELPILSCLSYIGNKPSGLDCLRLPSWVPDYRAALGKVPLIHLGNNTCFNASRINPAQPAPRRFLGHALGLRGRLVDSVVDFSIPLTSIRSTCYVISCIDTCLKLAKKYRTGQDRVEVIWRTLIADTTERPPIQHPAPMEYCDHFHDWMLTLMVRWFMNWEHQATSRFSHMDTIEELSDSSSFSALPTRAEIEDSYKLALEATETNTSDPLSRYQPGREEARNKIMQQFISPHVRSSQGFYLFDRAAKDVRSNRRLFRTREGYVGLAPDNVEYGDKLYLLNGARVPFLLRGNRLIGEAYVHGIMHGEMLIDDDPISVQII